MRLFAMVVSAVGVLLRQLVFALGLLERRLAVMVGGGIVMPRSFMVRRARARISDVLLAAFGF